MSKKNVRSYNIKLIAAPIGSKSIIKNLARFYVYELSRYSGEDVADDGLFEAYDACFKFDNYWNEPGHYPFIIRVDHKLAGFVLLNKKGSSQYVDWHLVEFYILASFQGRGIGRKVALRLLNKFTGVWEIAQMPANLPAIQFWRSVIQSVTNGDYMEYREQIKNPEPHEMIVQRFRT